MSSRQLSLAIIIGSLRCCVVAEAEGPTWIRDVEAAKQSAASEGKDLFILFTGHGWCYSCELLDRQVFQTAEFATATQDDYVLVELDFSFGDSAAEECRKHALTALQRRYLAPSIPTVILADPGGQPYAFITGYDTDSGPKAYLNRIAIGRNTRSEYQRYVSAAASKTGRSRAELLDKALESLSKNLGTIEERGDDAILHFYGDAVNEVIEIASSTGQLAEKYKVRRQRRDEWANNHSVLAKIDDFKSTGDYAGAINYIAAQLDATTDECVRWRLEYARQVYMEWSNRYEEALANCRRLLATEGLPEEYHEPLRDREVYNLFQLDRTSEGLAHYDRRLNMAAHDEENRKRLLFRKAQMLLRRDPVSQSIEAWQACRDAAHQGSDDWLTATALLARELQRAERHHEALRMLDEFQREQQTPWQLLDAAESHIALGDYAQARKAIDEAQLLNRNQADAPQQTDREQYARVIARINRLVRVVNAGSASAKASRNK